MSDVVIRAVPARLGAQAPAPNSTPQQGGISKAVAEIARHLKGVAAALDDLSRELSKP